MTKITFMRASYGSLESLLNYLKGSLIKDPFLVPITGFMLTKSEFDLE